MKQILFFLSLLGLACSSQKWDLEFINKALTKIVDKEVKQVADCFKEVMACTGNDIYPKCIDTPKDNITINEANIDVGQFFVIDLFNMSLSGDMHLKNTKFHGFSNFEVSEITSSVTVVPLGIEFTIKFFWDDVVFNSQYDLKDIKYLKYGPQKNMSGDGEMSVHVEKLVYKIVAHKILGGGMDYMKITPECETFDVEFDVIKLDGKELNQLVEEKFTAEFITGLDYDKLAKVAIKFFNDSLYPKKQPKGRATENEFLGKLGACIKNHFPE